MISKTNEYALRVMVHLAAQGGRPCGTRQIAAVTQVPPGYLSKILLELVKQGLILSQRGIHGGFVLARDPGDVSVFDVMTAIDPLARIRVCPLGLPAHSRQLCPLHKELDDAFELVERAFRRATLKNMVQVGGTARSPFDPVQLHVRGRPVETPERYRRPRSSRGGGGGEP